MSRGTRSDSAGKPLLGLVVALASVGLFLTVAACVDLTSTSPTAAAVVQTTTTTTIPASTTEATTTTEATVEESSAEPAPSPGEEEAVIEHEPTYWEWSNADALEVKSVRLGDHIKIRLTVDVASECRTVTWEVTGDTGVLLSQGMALHKTGPFIDTVVKNHEVVGTGSVAIYGTGNADQPGELLTLFRPVVTATE